MATNPDYIRNIEILGRTNSIRQEVAEFNNLNVFKFTGEFWTSRQRQASSIHEISYRACFKPQLPRFFIKRLSDKNDVVYDPFSGRGTTGLEAALLGRRVILNDVNPLSKILSVPRFFVPSIQEVQDRLSSLKIKPGVKVNIDLSMFYHPKTEAEIVSLRNYLLDKQNKNRLDEIDNWIRMVATNRLSGHSPGFFSVYSLPPNQAITPERQAQINKRYNQKPDYRDIKKLILKKTKSLLRNLNPEQIEVLRKFGESAKFLNKDARETNNIPEASVQLTVTSPPFLSVVQYPNDNWLRCWFNGLEENYISQNITLINSIEGWCEFISAVFVELYRITKKDGWVAFEVGEIKKRSVNLDELIVPIGIKVGFDCYGILVNQQNFTKTSNIWGIKNNKMGTNTNRIVLFSKG
jgi:DNA modification methylase